jgi:hypothetical protein
LAVITAATLQQNSETFVGALKHLQVSSGSLESDVCVVLGQREHIYP